MTLRSPTRRERVRVQPTGIRSTPSGELYIDMLDAATFRRDLPAMARAERAIHDSGRTCPVRFCELPLIDGECADHGRPAEDRGQWTAGYEISWAGT